MRQDPTKATNPSASSDDLIVDSPFSVKWTHRVRFTSEAFDPGNPALLEAICAGEQNSSERGMIVLVDQGVSESHPSIVGDLEQYCAANTGLPELRDVMQLPGGEQCKQDDSVVQRVLDAIDKNHICRKSTVVIIGGGALLDAAGYAAAIGHRGVRTMRMPSTVLSQCDSGVGVKNGINRACKKNFTGTFAPPWAVLCDASLLETLTDADWCSGFSEIVKIALLRDAGLLDGIERDAESIVSRQLASATPLIERSAILHMNHITEGGDPFELKEARPLDFGHWSAHKLEQMTDFNLRHGEAVSIGLALDLVYSQLAGIVDPDLSERVLVLLESLNLPTTDPALARTDELLGGIQEFREHLGGTLTITLVTDVERPIEVHEIDANLVREAVSLLLARSNS
jgi:3-dehydroquinate synthase